MLVVNRPIVLYIVWKCPIKVTVFVCMSIKCTDKCAFILGKTSAISKLIYVSLCDIKCTVLFCLLAHAVYLPYIVASFITTHSSLVCYNRT